MAPEADEAVSLNAGLIDERLVYVGSTFRGGRAGLPMSEGAASP